MSKKFKSSEGYLRVRMLSYLSLPPVSPELNPVEQVWQFLRQHQLTKPDVLKMKKRSLMLAVMRGIGLKLNHNAFPNSLNAIGLF